MTHYIILLVSIFSLSFSQSFGKNKVQYRDFDWSFIQSEHFDIYFYGGQQDLAEFASSVSEESYTQISKHLGWDLRKRVSILVYNSHNEFQQTNVVGVYMSEGIGGVTELFKNRVVFPFEGDYEKFRHVIHHELVHAMLNDMIYGGSAQNMVSSRTRVRIPIWANEGLAEFLSSNWDTKADMVLRDLSLHERIPTIQELNYFMAYKGGQSLWRFIAGKYGREKISEIFRSMKQTQNAEKGYQKALGMKWSDLSKQWHKYLKKEYWPDISSRDAIEDISNRLTDHKKQRNFYNVSPSISPDGGTVAMLSDRSGYFDIYLLDATTGKQKSTLVKGNRSIDFEELKWLQPGLSWSPNSKKIVFASKSGKGDVLHIVDVDSKKSKKIPIDLDGVFSAAWSPNGTEIAFIGNNNGSSDIYMYDLLKKEYYKITDDVFSDSYPSWNSDGTEIAFTSDRGQYVSGQYEGDIFDHNYRQTDIYIYNLDKKDIKRITSTSHNENHPIWSNTKSALYYTSDYNGVWNLYTHPLNSDDSIKSYAITNVLTGLQQPSISKSDDGIIFAGYSGMGWDLYRLSSPNSLKKKTVEPTQFIISKDVSDDFVTDVRKMTKTFNEGRGNQKQYSNWIFAQGYNNLNDGRYDKKKSEEKVTVNDSIVNGKHIPRAYKTKFSLDLISGNLQISNVFGAAGMTYFAFSDLLGDHQIAFGTEMVLTLENSDYYLYYAYLRNKTDYHFVGFQNADFFTISYFTMGRLRHFGFQTTASHPFNRFQRLDFGLSWHNVVYDILDQVYNPISQTNEYVKRPNSQMLTTLLPTFSWVSDNAVFGFTGPVDGFRQNSSITFSPKKINKNMSFQTIKLDIRKYWRLGRDYTFAMRGFLGKSHGENAQKFFLGGVPSMISGSGETNGIEDTGNYRGVITDTSNANLISDIYFAQYAFPLRGARFSERFGNSVALFNLEMRFPFINYLAMGFPLKIVFGNIRGHAFLDVGAAWDSEDEFSNNLWPSKYGANNISEFSPWVMTTGLGLKINLGYFLLRIETAWDKNPGGYSKPQWYFSLGPDW